MDPRRRRRHRVITVGTGMALLATLAFAPHEGGTVQTARVTTEHPLVGSLPRAGDGAPPAAASPAAPVAAPVVAPVAALLGVGKVGCVGAVAPKARPWYPGPSTSVLYDTSFKRGPALPDLAEYTPQGLAAWPNWDGAGHNLLVIAAYRLGHLSRLYGVDPNSGRILGTVRIAESHLGGIAISGPWLFTQAASKWMRPEGVNKFPLADLRAKMIAPGQPVMKPVGAPQTIYSADFMTSYAGEIWAGQHNKLKADRMYRYAVGPDGALTVVGGPWEVPARTQGVAVTQDLFMFVASDASARGRMWVVRRGEPDLDRAPGRCFRNPDLGQGMAIIGGTVFVSYESGAKRFDKPHTANKIRNLHETSVATVSALAQGVPAAVAGLGR
jgi:hypothetical protein